MQSPSMRLDLLDNALDYMHSAIQHFATDQPRSLKYAVLHLFAGIELLLKERLVREHWSLIFDDLDKAQRSALATGDLRSPDFATLCSRLFTLVNVEITPTHRQQLDRLRKLRNRLQHFHAQLKKDEVTSYLYLATGFAIDFVAKELPDAEATHREVLDELGRTLSETKDFVIYRLGSIEEELKAANNIVACPRCSQDTLMLGSGRPTCAFCRYSDDPIAAVEATVGTACVARCPECGGPMGEHCFQDGDVFICYSCGAWGR